MQILKCTIRHEYATKKPAMFFYDERGDLNVFTFEEGHSAASLPYMHKQTTPLLSSGISQTEQETIVNRFKAYYATDDIELYIKQTIAFRDNMK